MGYTQISAVVIYPDIDKMSEILDIFKQNQVSAPPPSMFLFSEGFECMKFEPPPGISQSLVLKELIYRMLG